MGNFKNNSSFGQDKTKINDSEHYCRFFDLTSDLMAVASTSDWRLKQVNPGFCQTLGWSEKELFDMPYMGIVHPQDHSRTEQAIEKLVAGKQMNKFEIRIQLKNGTYKWISWDAAPYLQDQLIYCLGRDVTHQRQMREKLIHLAKIPQESPNTFLQVSHEGILLWMNEAAENFSRDAWNLKIGNIVCDDLLKGLNKTLPGEEPFQTELTCGKRVLWLTFNVIDGYINVYGHDITDLKESEEHLKRSETKFRAVFEKAAIGMGRVRFDDARWIDVNDTFCNMLGYDRQELLVIPWPDITHPEDIDIDLKPFRQMAAGQLEKYTVEKRFIHKQGHFVWARLTLSLVRDEDGNPDYEIAVIEDISQRMQLEETLRRYELLASHSRDIILFLDRDGNILEANQAAVDTYGYTREQLLELTIFDLRQDAPPDLVKQQMDKAEQGMLFEATHKRKDGSTFPVEISSQGAVIEGKATLISIIRDITQRKKSEQELLASQEKLNTVIDSMPVGVIITGADGTITRINQAAYELWGIPPETTSLERYGEWVGWWPKTGQRIKAHEWGMARALTKGEVVRGELVQNQKFNSTERRYYLNNAVPLRNSEGEIIGGIVAMQDVTKRIETQLALRDSEQRFRGIFDNVGVGIIEVERDDNIINVNDRACQILGMSREQLKSMKIHDLTWPADREISDKLNRELHQGLRSGTDYEKRYVKRDGSPVWVHVTVSPVYDEHGKWIRSIGTMEDITERKQAQENLEAERARLQAVLDSIPVAVWFTDKNGRMIQANKAVENVWGGKAILVEGIDQYDQYKGWFADTGKPIKTHDWALARAIEKGETTTGEVINILRFDGKHGTLLNSASPVLDRQGNIIGGVVVALDITERKRAEDQLKKFNETLEQRVSERTQQLRALTLQLSQAEYQERKRLAKILHDHLQQLIVAAKMHIGWIQPSSDIEAMHETAKETSNILKEALKVSRGLAVDLSPPVLHDAGLIGGINWLASDMKKKYHFDVNVQLEKNAEPEFESLRILLFESVRELLLNSLKHSKVSEAQISLMLTPDNMIKIIVSDEGKGFDPDVLKKRNASDVSFGLFSIQERLAYIGGKMIIESAPNQGTRVTLTVPDGQAAEAARKVSQSSKKMQDTVKVVNKTSLCNVLIVDDHKIMRQGLARLFRAEPEIQVIGEATDGPEAIEKADRLHPDIIIMDINLGEMNGIEATRQILQRHPEIKIIGLSMHTDKDVADAMLAAGACDYRTKSDPSEELITAVRNCTPKKP